MANNNDDGWIDVPLTPPATAAAPKDEWLDVPLDDVKAVEPHEMVDGKLVNHAAPKTDATSAAIMGAAHGVSGGLVDEGAGVLEALGSKVGVRGLGGSFDDIRRATDAEQAQSFMDVYRRGRDAKRATYDRAREDRPALFGGGEVVGGGALAFAPGMSAGKGADVGQITMSGLKQGALSGFGNSRGDLTTGDPKEAGKVLLDTYLSGLVGSGAAMAGAGVGNGADWLDKKASSGAAKTLLVASKPVDKYLADPAKYQAPIDVESEALRLRPKLAEMERGVGDTIQSAAAAEAAAGEARTAARQQLRDMRPGPSAEEALTNALKAQRSTTSDLARQQREMVTPSTEQLSIEPVLAALQKRLKDREIGGLSPKIDPEVQDIEKMVGLLSAIQNRKMPADGAVPTILSADGAPLWTAKDALQAEGSKLVPKDLVNLRQTLDKVAQPAWTAPGIQYVPPGAAAAKDARTVINNILDNSATAKQGGYQQLRSELAQATRLAEESGDMLGNPDINKVLRDIANPDRAPTRRTLEQLDAATGGKIMPELREYLEAQAKLRNKPAMDQYLAGLPESQAAEAARAVAKAARAEQDKLHGLASTNVGERLRDAMFANKNNPKLETMAGLDELGSRTGEDLRDLVDRLGVRAAFTKEGANGSRLTKLAESAAPGILKGPASAIGAGMDVGRGRAAKAILDSYLNRAGWGQQAGRAAGLGAATPVIERETDPATQERQLQELLNLINKAR
jgi:hypothetical protein